MQKTIWIRTVLAVIVAELLPIIALVAIVAFTSTGNAASDQELAASYGAWIGPIGGAIATLLMAWWCSRSLQTNFVGYGALFGALVAGLDASIIFSSGEAFQPLFGFSWAGRVVAGMLGGLLAFRTQR